MVSGATVTFPRVDGWGRAGDGGEGSGDCGAGPSRAGREEDGAETEPKTETETEIERDSDGDSKDTRIEEHARTFFPSPFWLKRCRTPGVRVFPTFRTTLVGRCGRRYTVQNSISTGTLVATKPANQSTGSQRHHHS